MYVDIFISSTKLRFCNFFVKTILINPPEKRFMGFICTKKRLKMWLPLFWAIILFLSWAQVAKADSGSGNGLEMVISRLPDGGYSQSWAVGEIEALLQHQIKTRRSLTLFF